MTNPKVEKLPRPGRKMLRKKPNKLGEWREAVASQVPRLTCFWK